MYSLAEENYIKTIFHLEMEQEDGVSTNAIAVKMKTKPSSATDMVQKLAEKKMVSYQKYKGTLLTNKGKKIAANVIRKHRLWEVFLVDKLNFQWDEVHDIAEQLEHIKSDELISRLDRFLDHPNFDPHGDPIPDKNGIIKPSDKKLLSNLKENQNGICVGVKESSSQFLQYLDKLSINIGTKIKVLSIEEFDGSITVEVAGKSSYISEESAKNIYVIN